ncbi:hypothetical protein GOA91_29750 [Sinorhizobium meliloti]|nr:hypothetical protein [Sinorhizobium meliloti]MDX0272736.1 hypothetical protein [Sinorhizobium meliloti]
MQYLDIVPAVDFDRIIVRATVARQTVDVVVADLRWPIDGQAVFRAIDVVAQKRSLSKNTVMRRAAAINFAVHQRETGGTTHDLNPIEVVGGELDVPEGNVVGIDKDVAVNI